MGLDLRIQLHGVSDLFESRFTVIINKMDIIDKKYSKRLYNIIDQFYISMNYHLNLFSQSKLHLPKY